MLVAGGTGIGAAVASVVGLFARSARPCLAAVGACAVLLSTIDLALYFVQTVPGAPSMRTVAVLERVAFLVALGLARARGAHGGDSLALVAGSARGGYSVSSPYLRSLL